MEQHLSRLTQIFVENLFGHYTHTINLHLDSRVTIIHGPNGVGKTVLLKLIDSLFAGRYVDLNRVPFQLFRISLADGRTLEALPIMSEVDGAVERRTRFYLSTRDKKRAECFDYFLSSEMANSFATRIEADVPWLQRYDTTRWIDSRSGEILSSEDLISQYSSRLPERSRREMTAEPPWLGALRSAVQIHLIETQRLLMFPLTTQANRHLVYYNSPGTYMTSAVKSYAAQLRDTMSGTLARYATESQNRDQTFPQRLLSGEARALNTTDLKREMAELDKRRAELRQIGLIDENTSYPFNEPSLDRLDEAQRTVMALYVEDTKAKLTVLEGLSSRIRLLLQIVNRKFRHKQITVTRQGGLSAIGDDGSALDLESLSSGEQHELVLSYDLLFKVRQNTLVLIDEPELSLHVVWQRAFLPDIQSIVKASGFDVLVATHSPYIAADATDLMVELSDERTIA